MKDRAPRESRPTTERMRVFLAVFPPPQVQQAAARAIEALRREGDGVSWVKTQNLHYTLRFLGDVGESGARRAGEAAAEAAARHAPFEAELGELGAFPGAARPRVLWIGLARGEEALVALAREVEGALRRHGFERERRPFAAHLTIGRVRAPGDSWSEKLAAVATTPARWRVERVLLIRSTLSPQGSRYASLSDAPLAGAATAGTPPTP